MSAELKFISPIDLVVDAIRTCYLSEGYSDSLYDADGRYILGDKDKELVQRIIKNGHCSTLEHSLINFKVRCTRGCLQELARHRIAQSLSVQSTRYTLKKILNGEANPSEYLYKTGNQQLDDLNIDTMTLLGHIVNTEELANDVAKYGICESLLIELRVSYNFTSFRNYLKLRTSPRAHFEIRQLALDKYNAIPPYYQFLFEDCVHEVDILE